MCWFILFTPVSLSLLRDWINHSDNSHGFLVPIISLYFIWEKRLSLKQITISTSSWGAVLLIVSLLGYVLSFAGDIAFFYRIMMISSLIGLVLFNFGKEMTNALLFPLLFLLFMIPIPLSVIETISIPLQLFASTVSFHLIGLFSIPVLQEGNMLYFAETQLEVAQACSGLRSITALTMLSTVFVYISSKGLINKIFLLASSIPIALIANVIRVAGTGVLAHFFGGEVAKGFLHDFSGMVVFIFGLSVLYLEYCLLNKINSNRE